MVDTHACTPAQSCPTLCYPVNCSPPGSPVHGISQARILEWVAISSSRGSSWPRDRTNISCVSCIEMDSVLLNHRGSPMVDTAAAAAKSLQSCPTLCDPRDGSPPGSAVPGILQARTLEWVAISFSNAWSEKWKWSCSVVSDSSRPHELQPTRLLCPWDFPGKSTGVGCHHLLRGRYYSATKSNELLMWSMQQHEWIWKTLKNKRNWIQKSEYCMILLIFKNRQNSPLVIEIRTPESMQGGDWFNFLGPWKDFPVAQVIKESACNAEDQGSIPGLGRSSGKGNDNSLQYSCLENSMDREAWQATVHGVSKSQTRLSD